MPTKLRRHPETGKRGRRLHAVTGSVYRRVTYSGWDRDLVDNDSSEAYATALRMAAGPLGQFIVNLVVGGAWKQGVHS